ncbi:MAG TPA: cytochrome P450 [Acidimicrobiales bacterium]|nr:cytochrome P450 [Acidimicrobiales bacterium]
MPDSVPAPDPVPPPAADGAAPEDIYAFWAACRRDDPVMAIEGLDQEMRLLTRYAHIDEVLRDAERFPSRINADTMGPVMGTVILAMDGDEHRRYRNLVARAFRPSALVRWEEDLIAPTIHRLIDTVVDRGACDLVADVTSRYPVQVIAGVLGVPTEDYELFQRWGLEISKGPEDYDVSKAAAQAMREYLTPLVEQRKAHPGDDLVSDIVTAEIDGERLGDEHIYGFLRLLLPAGAETTFRALGNCLLALLSRPAVLDRVKHDRTLLDPVIEETLRWETSVTMVNRETACPVELGGVTIPAGVSVVCATGSANHDEARYDNAEVWDLDRPAAPHLAFGTGRHQCLGMHLARLELRVGLSALFDRLPRLRLDPSAAAPHIEGLAFRSPPRLDVLFDTGPLFSTPGIPT